MFSPCKCSLSFFWKQKNRIIRSLWLYDSTCTFWYVISVAVVTLGRANVTDRTEQFILEVYIFLWAETPWWKSNKVEIWYNFWKQYDTSFENIRKPHYSSLWQACYKGEAKTNLQIVDINRQWWAARFLLSPYVPGCSGESSATGVNTLNSLPYT